MILLNGFPGLLHEHKAEHFQCLSMQLVEHVGAGSLADADRASLADLAIHRWP
ncbi:hypothetical protein D3C81_2198120 [compost metagenome]